MFENAIIGCCYVCGGLMKQPRGVSLPPFGQCLCIAKLAVAHIIHKYRGANFAKRGHNCLTNNLYIQKEQLTLSGTKKDNRPSMLR